MTVPPPFTSGPPAPPFTVAGRRVLVVGAARSGRAAAELLVCRGATVTLTDRAADVPDAERLRRAGVTLDLGGHAPRLFTAADLDRDESRRAARAARTGRRPRGRRRRHR